MPSAIRHNRAVFSRIRTWIFILVTLHLVLAANYANVTPYRAGGILYMQGKVEVNDIGAPDERQHANYIGYIANEHAFPVFKPGDPNLYESYQSHQPPLYYLLSAGWAKVTGSSATTLPASGMRIRWFNCFIGAMGVLGVAMLALWGTKSEKIVFMATAFAALLPMNVALSGAISNDPLLICLCTWCLAFMAKMARNGWTLRDGLLCALFAGLSLLTKTTALALLPVVMLCILMIPAKNSYERLGRAFGLCALAIAIASPWLIRNMNLYGDPFAIKAFNQAFVGNPKAADFIARMGFANYWRQDLYFTMCSFFGIFGYWEIWLDQSVYNVMGIILGCFFIGWYLSLRPNPDLKQFHLINGVFLFLIIALFIRFNMQYFQAQGRYIMPAVGPIAVGVGCAVDFFSKKRAVLVAGLLALALLGLNLWVIRQLPFQFSQRITKSYIP